MGAKYNHSVIYFLVLIVAFSIVGTGQEQPSTPYSYENQLDINNASYEEIALLPVPREIAERIYERIQYQGPFSSFFELRDIEGITQEILLKLKPLVRIEPYREISEREERLSELYYRFDRWGGDEGTNQALIDYWIEQALEPANINQLRYDELWNLQSVSPVDAAAIISYRNQVGEITSSRDLRNAPYLSYFGYRNARNFISFEPPSTKREFHGNILFRMTNTPFMTDEADVTSTSSSELISIGENDYPDVYTRLIAGWGQDVKLGLSHWHSLGEPTFGTDLGFMEIPRMKFYLGLENQRLGPIEMRKLYIGNYSVTFGQGVVMESTDFFIPRKSGFGFRKRFSGLAGDNSRTRQYKLTGAAAEFAFRNAHLFLFGSFDKRDAVLNKTPVRLKESRELINPINQFIVLDQRFEYAPLDSSRLAQDISWRSTVKELLYGFHAAYDILPATQIGLTYYESAYDRPIRPNIEEIVEGSNIGQVTLADNEILNSYGGEVSDGENPFWKDAKSFRRIYGVNFQTVYQNVAFQAEYAELDKKEGLALFRSSGNPWAFVGNIYVQYNSFYLMGLYRNYQLGFDNPYQRSFSNYRRFDNTIYEDYFYLQDSFYLQLYSNNPQPQNESGFYFLTRYQINRNFTLTMEYDNWKRNADDVTQFRLRGTLEFRPVFPIRIRLRQKFQGREPQNEKTLQYFDNTEFRGTASFRLSRFDELGLLYLNAKVKFRPRSRLSHPVEPGVSGTNYAGTAALTGGALGGFFTHNFGEWLKLKGFLGYYRGFFWSFEDTQFMVMDSERGALRFWISVYSRISRKISVRLKYTRDRNYPITFYQARDSNNQIIIPEVGNSVTEGKYFQGYRLQQNQEFYYLDFNFHF
jgi:DNA uptake protein ComE-like DNA-binding protein